METVLADIPAFFVEAADGVAGAQAAFRQLESRLKSLRGRKFYGTFYPAENQYRACVAVESGDDPNEIGLPIWTIPGGKYARRKLEYWPAHLDEIPKIFDELVSQYAGQTDPTRPGLEFYKSQKELLLLLPIT